MSRIGISLWIGNDGSAQLLGERLARRELGSLAEPLLAAHVTLVVALAVALPLDRGRDLEQVVDVRRFNLCVGQFGFDCFVWFAATIFGIINYHYPATGNNGKIDYQYDNVSGEQVNFGMGTPCL